VAAFDYYVTKHVQDRIYERCGKSLTEDEIIRLVESGKIIETAVHRYVRVDDEELGRLTFPCIKEGGRFVIKTVITPDMNMAMI
jgi:hypothetical protein